MINMIVDFVNSFTLFCFALPLSRILSNLRFGKIWPMRALEIPLESLDP